MSHIGSKEIKLPNSVSIDILDNRISVKGVYGALELEYKHVIVDVVSDKNTSHISVKPDIGEAKNKDKNAYILWGTYRTLIDNMIIGVSQGYTKTLSLVGVGYKASLIDKATLSLKVGYSIDLLYRIPNDVKIECPKPDTINVFGINKQRVHQVAAEIRSFRQPEPYKGKGIRYLGEVVRTKEGKKK